MGAFVELAKGVATGEAPNVNRIRYLSEAELAQCGFSSFSSFLGPWVSYGSLMSGRALDCEE